MSQQTKKVLRGTLWKLEDVNELQRELLVNIGRLDGDQKSLKRVANLVSDKLGLIRALIHAERLLEDEDGVEFIREIGR